MARTNKYTSINFNEIYEKKAATTTGSSPSTGRYTSLSSGTHPGKSYSFSASSRSHGMLVLSRPSPKPVSHPQPPPQTQTQTQPQSHPIAQSQPQHHHQPESSTPLPSAQPQTPPPTLTDQSRVSESISLRPLGKTGTVPLISTPPSPLSNPNPVSEKEKESSPVSLPKSDKFVPPHLRPGFNAKEGRPATPPGGGRGRDLGGYRTGALGSSPNRYGDDRRPKSGSGYERSIGRRGAGIGGGGGHEFCPGEMITTNRPRSGGYRPGSSG